MSTEKEPMDLVLEAAKMLKKEADFSQTLMEYDGSADAAENILKAYIAASEVKDFLILEMAKRIEALEADRGKA